MVETILPENTALGHLDERLGHVAVDLGLLTREQVAEVTRRMIGIGSGGSLGGFADAAVEMGLLNREQVTLLESEELRRRRLINGYEIIDIIGTGTIATVYHAKQVAMDRDVALKILHPRLAADPVFVRAYIAEAQAVSRFHHPNIVQGFDAGESNGFYYFAHEYLSGGSVADRLARLGGEQLFSENQLLQYLRQTTSALKHAWAVAVYHGDINPGNLLLDGQGNIKLANLGVPRVADMRGGGARQVMPGFVRCGPEYAAPEQLSRPDLVDARSDMFNLGATFYHISFGVPPFAPGPGESLADHRRNNPMPSFSLKSQENYSGKYLRLIHDMLETDPANRPADPEALQARLEKFHNPDSERLSSLAQLVRQSPGPSTSARLSVRSAQSMRAPHAHGLDRPFSLRTRLGGGEMTRGMKWLAAALFLLIAAVVVGIVFMG